VGERLRQRWGEAEAEVGERLRRRYLVRPVFVVQRHLQMDETAVGTVLVHLARCMLPVDYRMPHVASRMVTLQVAC
jgi:hypothetical protein